MDQIDAIVRLLLEKVERKPKSGADALAFLSYIMDSHIEPVVEKLKEWALSELDPEEAKLTSDVIKEAISSAAS